MGNSIIVKRVKGITQYYAKSHIDQYKKGDFLRLVPEFDNPYDRNALAIYDDYGHKLGYVDKYCNHNIYQTIKDVDYICIITSVFTDISKPSIEFEIIYRTTGMLCEITDATFSKYLEKYNSTNNMDCDANYDSHRNDWDFSTEKGIRTFFEIEFNSFKKEWSKDNNFIRVGEISSNFSINYFTFMPEEIYDDKLEKICDEIDRENIEGFIIFYKNHNDVEELCSILEMVRLDKAIYVTLQNGEITYKNVLFDDVDNLFWPVTNLISFLQNPRFVLALKEQYAYYTGLEDPMLRIDYKVNIPNFGELMMKKIKSETIKTNFGMDTNNYFVLFMPDGGLFICTCLTDKYSIHDSDFIDYCVNRDKECKYNDIFLKPMSIESSDYVYVIYKDYNTIDNFKRLKRWKDKEINLHMIQTTSANLKSVIMFIENYRKEFMEKY